MLKKRTFLLSLCFASYATLQSRQKVNMPFGLDVSATSGKRSSSDVAEGCCAPPVSNCDDDLAPHDPCEQKSSCQAKVSIHFGSGCHAETCRNPDYNCVDWRSLFFTLWGAATIQFIITMAAILTCQSNDVLLGRFIYSIIVGLGVTAVIVFSTRHSNSLFEPFGTIAFMLCKRISYKNGFLTLLVQPFGWLIGTALVCIFFNTTVCGFGTPTPGLMSGIPSSIVPAPVIPVSCGTAFWAEAIGTFSLVIGTFFAATGSTIPAVGIGALLAVLSFVFVGFSGAAFGIWSYLPRAFFSGVYDCVGWYIFADIIGGVIAIILISIICRMNKWCRCLSASVCPPKRSEC